MSDLFPQPSDLLPLLPGAATGAVAIGIAAWLRSARVAAALGAIGVATALVVTWLQIHGSLPIDPVQSTERTLWCAVGWTLVAVTAFALLPPPRAAAGIPVLLAASAAGAVCWIVSPFLGRLPEDPAAVSLAWALSLGAGIGLLAAAATAAHRQAAPLVGALCTATAVGTTGHVLFLFGSASLAQLCGSVALAGGTGLVLTLARRRVADTTLLTAVGCGALFAVDGYVFLDDTPSPLALGLLGAVPLLPWLARLRVLRQRHPMAQTAVLGGLALVLAAAAVGVAIAGMPAPDPYADGYR